MLNFHRNSMELIGIGVAMGVVHVMTGPDHLSALATLSANKNKFEAMGYGIRWGFGHSMGLIIITTILYLIDNEGDFDLSKSIEHLLDFIVGIFMILLGCYGLRTIDSKNKRKYKYLDKATYQDRNVSQESLSLLEKNQSEYSKSCSDNPTDTDSIQCSIDYEENNERNETVESPEVDNNRALTYSHGHCHHHHELQTEVYSALPPSVQKFLSSPHMSKVMAFCIGIVHGLAGPGGILGVIPAVQLHNVYYSTLYLGTFCVTSILIMGLFAGSYGSFTSYLSHHGNCEGCLDIFSACLSLVIGCLWCTLILTGQMDKVFPEG